MKNYGYLSLFILVLGSLCWFGLPWWSLAVVGLLAGLLFENSPGGNFGLAFAAGTMLWSGFAYWLDLQNGGVLSAKVGELFKGLSSAQLIWVTGAIGGLLAGFGTLTGTLARQAFAPKKKRRRSYYW